ncbi:hypothetical protein E8E12_005924 [Didymella heteroderae]|uniref:Heterokaryon incompatibility domain-containing protein n=1 Tax=Didymella heteroderae TaxID=1769908 RepID=A0A9P4WPN4_9PLEO|nr:hypothetical protein E8E12_005924 [Didymella heteroderae]
MGRIYRNADRVLICMSPCGEEHGPKVVALLEYLCAEIDSALLHINKKAEEMKREGEWEIQWSPWDWFPFAAADAPVLSDPRWESVNALVEQEWFSRGWVVREAALAHQGLVIWGNTEFSWHDLMRVLVWRHRRAVKAIPIPAEDRFRSHLEAYEANHKDIICTFYQEGSWKPCSLLDYIHFARALQLKDSRDRIYAFLDLANDSAYQLRIVPNYNETPSNVYRDFATDYVAAVGDVDLLHYVKHNEETLKSTTMTWAPDWSIREGNFISFVSTSENYPPLRSHEGRVSKAKLIDGTALHVEGVVIDSVHFLSKVWKSDTTTVAALFALWTSVRRSRPEPHYPTPYLLEAFFDALSMANFYGDMGEWLHARRAYITMFERLSTELHDCRTIDWDTEEVVMLESSNIHKFISSTTAGKRFIVTERGCYGLAPAIVKREDLCVIIFGCSCPCLLRTRSIGSHYVFLGPGFILGKKTFELDGHDTGFYSCLGVEESKDWIVWDVKEQDIYLC